MTWGSTGTTRKTPMKRATENAFRKVVVYLPIRTADMLENHAIDHASSSSRLAAIAIDNEFDQVEKAFGYPCEIPTSPPYVEYQYVDEAGKIYNFLSRFTAGLPLETLVLCRRDAGISSREVFLLAMRELIEKQMVELFSVKPKFRAGAPVQRYRVMKE